MSTRLVVVLCIIGVLVALLIGFAVLFGPQALMVYSMKKMATKSPECSVVPQKLLLPPLDPAAGRRVAYFGYEFALPWPDAEEEDVSQGQVRLKSDAGELILLSKSAALPYGIPSDVGQLLMNPD